MPYRRAAVHRRDQSDGTSRRHGTTTLFAALEVATGKILATRSKGRRRREFLDFMDRVTAAFPNRQQVEVWFSILQGQSLSGASFTSLKQLEQHIDACINAYNDKAEPFV